MLKIYVNTYSVPAKIGVDTAENWPKVDVWSNDSLVLPILSSEHIARAGFFAEGALVRRDVLEGGEERLVAEQLLGAAPRPRSEVNNSE